MSQGGRFMNLLMPEAVAATDGIIMPSKRPQQDVSGRVFVFFIDDANIPFLDTPRLRDNLHMIVKTLFHEGDLVAMVSSGMSSIEVDPTYDLNRVDDEISKIAGSAMTPQDIIQAAQTQDGPAGLRYQANLAFRTAMDMLSQMGSVSGKRKSFIWISCGYDFNPFQASRDQLSNDMNSVATPGANGQPTNLSNPTSTTNTAAADPFQQQGAVFSQADLIIELSRLSKAANLANTPFYSIDPRGLMTDMANTGRSVCGFV